MLFDVESTSIAGRPALTVRGELDLETAPQFAAAVDSALAARPRALVVDLTPTTFLDSSGARQIALTARQAIAAGVVFHVIAPRSNGPVRLTVDLLELGAFVPIVGEPAEIPTSIFGRDTAT